MTLVWEPIFKLFRKDLLVKWNEKDQLAFDKIKKYLANQPILKPPKSELSLTLYLAIKGNVIGAMLTHEREEKAKHAVYYLSKKMLPYEENYNSVEQICLAMVCAMKKLIHYF